MNLSNVSEIITFQITLYSVLYKVFKIELTKHFRFLPVITIISIGLLYLLNYNYIDFFYPTFFLINILNYFIFPVVFTRNFSKRKVIYLSVFIVGVFSLINAIFYFIITFINPEPSTIDITYFVIDIIVTTIFLILLTKHKPSNIIFNFLSLSKGVKATTLVFIWELVVFLSLLVVLLTTFPQVPIIILFSFLIIIILLVSFAVFYLLITNNFKSIYYKQLNTTIENNMNEQVRYYEKLAVANESLRKFHHDFNNLKIGLNTYLKTNDTAGAIHYLNDCNMLIEKSDEILHTGHHIVDALFSDKLQTVKENNININFEGLIPSDILTPVDLCIIFGNTLDNAIEACLNIKDNNPKNINVSVKQNRDYIFITFTNPCAENVAIKNDTILTTKENTEIHGIGLYSIKQVLKKYDGHLTLRCENKLFTTEIDFCISTK